MSILVWFKWCLSAAWACLKPFDWFWGLKKLLKILHFLKAISSWQLFCPRETSTGTPAGTRKNQQIMMEQNPFPEERKKREEARQAPEPKKREERRQAPEPQPEPRETSKSWWNRTPFLRKENRERKGDKHRNTSRNQEEPANHDGTEPLSWRKKERREKKGDKHRNPSRNQEEPANHDGTEPVSWGKKERRSKTSTGTKEERRRETSTGTPAGTKRNQQIMMEQNPFPEERKQKEGRQAPEPQPEPRGTSKPWWNRTPFLRKERREKKGDKHQNPNRNQEKPANHEGTENPIQLKSCVGKYEIVRNKHVKILT